MKTVYNESLILHFYIFQCNISVTVVGTIYFNVATVLVLSVTIQKEQTYCRKLGTFLILIQHNYIK